MYALDSGHNHTNIVKTEGSIKYSQTSGSHTVPEDHPPLSVIESGPVGYGWRLMDEGTLPLGRASQARSY